LEKGSGVREEMRTDEAHVVRAEEQGGRQGMGGNKNLKEGAKNRKKKRKQRKRRGRDTKGCELKGRGLMIQRWVVNDRSGTRGF